MFSMTLISWFLGPSILGGMSANSGTHLLKSDPSEAQDKRTDWPHISPPSPLTQDADEGIGQQVAILVGSIALVDGAAAHLHGAEDDGVTEHLSARVGRRTCA